MKWAALDADFNSVALAMLNCKGTLETFPRSNSAFTELRGLKYSHLQRWVTRLLPPSCTTFVPYGNKDLLTVEE